MTSRAAGVTLAHSARRTPVRMTVGWLVREGDVMSFDDDDDDGRVYADTV
jgi:hypothetical protein